jgi:serine/threonine protein kinase
MSPQRFQQIRNLYEAALEQDTDSREGFVAAACEDDSELHQEVNRLLDAHEATFTLAPVDSPRVRTDPGSREGHRLGTYEILRLLGRGGMGSVYLARRADEHFQKKVAIKILRTEAATQDIVRRFYREREILAQLDHAFIARLLDAGSTEDGLPYFVMEYVEGVPITEYADVHRLTMRERIDLFGQVCDAVEYAHRRKVVHRDLKPGNVLVTAEGQVKLLDFGIARLLEPIDPASGSEGPALTQTGLWLMTPEYASPEQVRGERAGRASDVYSLGVILFELLTGHRPYHLRSRIFHEIVRVVCEQPPTRPSTVITQPVETRTADGKAGTLPPETSGRLRQASLSELKRELSGDLDNIVLKALNKDESQRYRSADGLKEDLNRHGAGLRVSAKGISPLYLARRFLTRHRWWVVAALALSIGLATGAVRVNPLVARQAAVVILIVVIGYCFARTEFGTSLAVRRVFPHLLSMIAITGVAWTYWQMPHAVQMWPFFCSAIAGYYAVLLARWPWRDQWAGPLLVDARRPRSAQSIVLLIGMLVCVVLLVRLDVSAWMAGHFNAIATRGWFGEISYLILLTVFAVYRYWFWTRIEVRGKGLLVYGRFLRWDQFEGHGWAGGERGLSVLRIRLRRPWWRGSEIPIPEEKKEAVEAILEQQLGEWPDRS